MNAKRKRSVWVLASAGALARRGVLVRRLQGLEALATVNTVVFDKTGTLTRDGMVVRGVHTQGALSSADALALADGPSLNAAVKREGLVFKSLCGSQSWKAISNKWLLKHE